MTDETPRADARTLADDDFWICSVCGSSLGYPIDSCTGLLLDEEDGGDTRHPPVLNPMTWEQRYHAARRNVVELAGLRAPAPDPDREALVAQLNNEATVLEQDGFDRHTIHLLREAARALAAPAEPQARELVRSSAFWRVVARMRGLPGAGNDGT